MVAKHSHQLDVQVTIKMIRFQPNTHDNRPSTKSEVDYFINQINQKEKYSNPSFKETSLGDFSISHTIQFAKNNYLKQSTKC